MMLFGLITEANFFVVFIALIVIFFLLGFLLGNIFGRPKKALQDKSTSQTKENKDKPQQADILGQDNQVNLTPKQETRQNQPPGDPNGYRYYRWW